MEEKKSKQHVQLPNNMVPDLNPTDLLVYVSIKRYMNKETKTAFPSVATIADHAGCTDGTVRKSINKLVEKGYLIKQKLDGKSNQYKFTDYSNFEPFSYEFLDNKSLTTLEKSYLIASQQYMFKDEGLGKISLTNDELSKRINMSLPTMRKAHNGLELKGFGNQIALKARNTIHGLAKSEKVYYLDELGQAIVFTLQAHDEQIQENTKDIEMLKQVILQQQEEINKLKEIRL